MKVNKKALELIEKGLSSKTVSKLTESQIDTLHSKLFVEAVTTTTTTSYNVPTEDAKKGVTLPPAPAGKKMTIQQTPTGIKATPTEEVTEDETDDVTDNSALGDDALSLYTGQNAPHDTNDMAPDGMDDDSDDDRSKMGMAEEKNKFNPWAICTSQLGKEFGTKERHLWSSKEKNKYERCVKDVKKSLKEGKNSVSLYLESQIMKIVEKNLPPRITKGDLIKHLTETSVKSMKQEVGEQPTIAPTKPGTKPTTKPGTRPKPKHPGQNPNPGVDPAPKAKKISPEDAKDKVIDVILNLLKK